jgi:hypothetical protein
VVVQEAVVGVAQIALAVGLRDTAEETRPRFGEQVWPSPRVSKRFRAADRWPHP